MRTRLMRASLLTPILLALLFVAAGSASGQQPNPNLFYSISAMHSSKCLDVEGAALGNGAAVNQWDCHGGQNQQWLFTPVGDGFYKITARHSGKALTVYGGIYSTNDGIVVQQFEYNGLYNQMWSVNDLGGGYYEIKARHSGRSLDVRWAWLHNGAPVQQYWFANGANQKWKLTPLVACP
jgi:glucosylceramidase